MHTLNKINITQFKNYAGTEFDFRERIIGICGLNGMGKTNLLDAIHYLCFTRSYFSNSDILNVNIGAEGFRLQGEFLTTLTPQLQKVVCIYRSAAKKEFYLNDTPYEKFSAHIGKFPCVVIAPDDVEILTGSSEERRKFIDTVLSQMNAVYLQQLITYNKILQQRNSLLKQFADGKENDHSLLDVLDEQLTVPGDEIFRVRKVFCGEMIPLVKKFYGEIAGNDEVVEVTYESQLNEGDFYSHLKRNREKDLVLQRTSVGIHKDDIYAQLCGRNFKSIASQGQKKSLLFALKFAEFELLKEDKGFPPLLLLDDIFEKLDDRRMKNLLQRVCIENSGQVFITDTHNERLTASLAGFGKRFQVIQLT